MTQNSLLHPYKDQESRVDLAVAPDSFGIDVAGTAMAYRQIYADAPGQGSVVWAMEDIEPRAARAATAELHAIFRTLNLEPKHSTTSRPSAKKLQKASSPS